MNAGSNTIKQWASSSHFNVKIKFLEILYSYPKAIREVIHFQKLFSN